MDIEVFNRYETKYILTARQYERILERLDPYMEADAFVKANGMYTISNIYYDTVDNHLIRNSLGKPVYKEKLRLRGYGVPQIGDKVYLEIKKKYKGLVNKRRTNIVLKDAYRYMDSGIKPQLRDFMNGQVLKEIDYMVHQYELMPKLYLAYDRNAMFARDGHDIRITFDTNIRTRREDLRLELGDYGSPLVNKDYWLMEVKAEHTVPIWLSRILTQEGIVPASFSKYGTEYTLMIKEQEEREGLRPCLTQYLAQPDRPLASRLAVQF